jgi:hypothetical protein
MKTILLLLLAAGIHFSLTPAQAATEEPLTYVIQKGDTLWGLSERFLKDPYFWPDLWARNPVLTNPHVIFPGQKVKYRNGQIEIEEPKAEKNEPSTPADGFADSKPPGITNKEITPKEITFTISGSEGFLMDDDGQQPIATIISTYQNRQISGEDDIVYTSLGRANGGKVGDRYSIYQKSNAISHPVTSQIVGYKIIPLGTLQIAELEEKNSKAIITKSYLEIVPGAYLAPYKERKRTIALKAADVDLKGYIVETKTGNKAIAMGDIAYLDMGASQGIKTGNMLYVVRDVQPDQKFIDVQVGKLPPEVIGALVIVDTTKTTSTALVVKSIDTIYRADRVELIKSR